MGAINMLHLRFKAETGLEAGGGYYKTITVKPGVVERVWVSDSPRKEYVEWIENLVDKLEEKMDNSAECMSGYVNQD